MVIITIGGLVTALTAEGKVMLKHVMTMGLSLDFSSDRRDAEGVAALRALRRSSSNHQFRDLHLPPSKGLEKGIHDLGVEIGP